MPVWLAVALGGAVGTLGRYGIAVWARALWPGFPVATFVVNAFGGLVMGVLASYAAARPEWSSAWRLGLMTGVLGGFTTFSAFSLETLSLWREGAIGLAFSNIALNVVVSLVACGLGLLLGRSL